MGNQTLGTKRLTFLHFLSQKALDIAINCVVYWNKWSRILADLIIASAHADANLYGTIESMAFNIQIILRIN